jgi:putative transposase
MEFIVELASRRIVSFCINAHPIDLWLAQQLRKATSYGQNPRFLIRERDRKYGRLLSSGNEKRI